MATGRFVTDLDRGDVMGPVDYMMSRFVVREYCNAVEMHQPCFQGIDEQIAPPTLVQRFGDKRGLILRTRRRK